MKRHPMRRLAGGALAAALACGCGTDPLAMNLEPDRLPGEDAPYRPVRAPSGEDRTGDRASEPLPVLDESASLDSYLRYAALNNAGLESHFQDWKAAVERIPQVGALPDPRFTYGYYINEIETRVGPMQQTFALSQTFPWFGKLRDRKDAAARHADAVYQRFEAARLALFLKVEDAHNELYFLKRSMDVTRDNIELLQQFERVARARYRVAAAGHPDLIRIQVELGKMEDRLRQLADLRRPYSARLNAALNRPAETPLPWPATVSDRITDHEAEELLAVLGRRNPELIALQQEIERERARTKVARKDGLPDVTLGMGYTVIGQLSGVALPENGDDALLATVSVNIPLWRDKYDAEVRESLARRLSIANRRQEQRNQLTADLQEAIFEHRDARRRVDLYRDTLIPKSNESIQASLAGFEQGTSDFLDLVDTERTLLEFQLGLERALADRATSYARIESLVGMPLSEIELDQADQAGEETVP